MCGGVYVCVGGCVGCLKVYVCVCVCVNWGARFLPDQYLCSGAGNDTTRLQEPPPPPSREAADQDCASPHPPFSPPSLMAQHDFLASFIHSAVQLFLSCSHCR